MNRPMRTVFLALLALSVLAPVQAQSIEALEKKYNLSVVCDAPSFPVVSKIGRIEGKAALKSDLDSYRTLLVEEWSRYPVELVAKTGLKRIILCQDLAYNGQKRTAIPDFIHDDLYLDVSRGRYNEGYVRMVIHHEYFHIIDWRDDGQLYRDPVWAALNTPGFHYGTGGAAVQNDSTVSLLTDALPGFLTKYSASGVEEDKAELFAHALVEPETVAKRAEKDTVLAAKLVRLKELLQSYVPSLTAAFWDKREEKPH